MAYIWMNRITQCKLRHSISGYFLHDKEKMFFMFVTYRPMIQKKLDVLGKAGLSKDNFSSAETTRLTVRSL
jgi:hypothetical protein